MSPVFEAARCVAGLRLNANVCILASLCPYSAATAKQIEAWFRSNIPAWAKFVVEPYATYIGFMVGPSVDQHYWVKPIEKWRKRAVDIAGKQVSPTLVVHQYNSSAVSCLQYVGQLIPLSSGLNKLELCTITAVLHLPQSTLNLSAANRLHDFSGPKVQGLAVTSVASHMRCSLTTISNWSELLPFSRRTYTNKAAVSRAFSPESYRSHWKSDSFVLFLVDAQAHNIPHVQAALCKARKQICKAVDAGSRTPKVQSSFAKALHTSAYNSSLAILLPKRFHAVCVEITHIVETHFCEVVVAPTPTAHAGHFVLCCIQFACGGWATSRRMHESPRKTFLLVAMHVAS